MTTLETEKAELALKMAEAEKQGQWKILAELALHGEALDPEWFVAAAYYQAATIELVGEQFCQYSIVREAVAANRRVRALADKLGP